MVLADNILVFDRPFWNALWVLFIIIPLFLIWVFALLDVFSRDDLGGGGKVLWIVAIIFLPFIGTIVYLIVRPASRIPTPVATASGRPPATAVDQLSTLARLHDQGKLTDAEYAAAKATALSSGS